MKAINRAIARTVSQLARYGGDEFHPLMKHALVQHLSMLLAMERKQLEQAGMKFATLTGDGTGEALPAININSAGCTGHVDAKAVAAHLIRGLKRSRVSGGIIASSTPQENGRTAWERYLDSGVVSDDLIKGLGLKREGGPEFVVPNVRDCRAAEHPVPVEQGLHIDEGDVLTRLSNGQPGVWTFGADYTVMAVAADGDVTVRDDSGYPRVMSAEAVRRHFSVAKKQTEPAETAKPTEQEPPSLPLSQWMAGDKIFFVASEGWGFSRGKEYEIIHINMLNGFVTIKDDAGNEREFGPGPLLNASFKNYSRRTDEQADVEHHAAKVLDAMAAPAPDAAPAPAYQVGDMLEYAGESGEYFTRGNLYPVSAVSTSRQYPVYVIDDEGDEHGLRKCLPEFINRGQPAPRPAPDAIDMTDPRNWQVGDVVVRTSASNALFLNGEHCTVTENNENMVRIANKKGSCSATYPHGTQHDGAENYFTWLRHGDTA